MANPLSRRLFDARFEPFKLVPVAALAVAVGLLTPAVATAQGHGGGGGGHGGGGAAHAGGGYHGGGYGGGWHGGGYGGWGWRGGWGGWGCCGWGWGGWYPGFGIGIDAYDPFWAGYPPDYYGPAAVYPPAPDYAPGPGSYYPQQPYPSPAPQGQARRGGIYTWNLGIQGGTCNRAAIVQASTQAAGPVGASFAGGAPLGGIVVNTVIGGKIGARLDLADQTCATAALELAQTGRGVTWQSAAGIPVTIEPTRSYSLSDGQPCRDYVVTAKFATQRETAKQTACRNASTGGWQLNG